MESTEDRMQYVNDLIESFREKEEKEEAERVNSQAESEGQKEGQQNGENEETKGEQDQANNEGIPHGLSTPVNVTPAEKPKKKKKKKKSKTAGLPEAGSELADDYQEKYDEDVLENPYDPERPLAQRVEYAIWKYRRNHKFSEARKAVFDNYLRFGGITTGPNAFMGRATGGDQDADGEADWDAAKMGTDVVPQAEDDEDLEVNFTEVAQVYLGNTFVAESRFIGLQDFIDAPILVDAFLRYLQIRQVCPEYADDIARAREIVALAKVELPMCKRATTAMPGEFNRACCILFEGGLKGAWVIEASWAQATAKTQKLIDAFKESTTGDMDEKTLAMVDSVVGDHTQRKVVDERDYVFVKIVDIASNDNGDDKNKEEEEKKEEENSLVKVTLVEYDDPEKKYEILLEKSITKDLRKDFVMKATMFQLDTGHWYLDRATQLMPSFYMVDDCLDEETFFRD
ncbi:Argonaute siRNA chaperone complex subunit Arb1-domain-containing protein [Phascolomyces articulosus]|uniref:Argonaute siRNA chaperone complex subunit Arb1-domain-containing protein n=1 Tax=Phascolomyces articulosus TaxID=60185 RepID=A0AAD5JWG8_9FUNG|nr:Argonaute siRNA chaperone complex subunit Arb1-domain-containing protein [Phascolomyces articulosus]